MRKPLSTGTNGKPQPLPAVYTPLFQDKDTDTEELDLSQLLAIARRRAVVIAGVALAVSAAIGFWTIHSQPKYEGKFRLLVEPVTAEDKFAGLTQTADMNGANPQQSGLDYTTQIQVLQSPKLMAPIVKQLQARYPDITYDSLLDKLAIARFQETKILEVRYRDTNPQKVQFVLEHLSQGYLKYSLQERQTNLRQGNEFVDEQMPQLRLRVNTLQRELQGFRQEYNFIDPEVKAQQLSTEVSAIEQQRLDTQKQIAEARALDTILQGSSGPASALNEAPIYQKLMGQLREVESDIAAQTVRFKEASPVIEGLREKRENLLPLLQQEAARVLGNKVAEVANQISVLEVRAAAIAQTEVSLNQQVKQLPSLAREYTDLQRELKVATDSLNRFLEKRELLQIEIAQKEVPWQLIAASQLPKVPVSPNVNRNLLIGVVAGLLAGMAAALLLEKLDNVFHSPEDLKQRTKLPLLGVIPFQKGLKISPVARVAVKMQSNGYRFVLPTADRAQAENFPFLEAFRSLFTNISFLSSDAPIDSLVVSSSAPADGKSTVAVNMAQAAAAMGQRVLLVDADLRLPRIHALLDLPNEQGLSNVIAANFPVLDAIQRSPTWDNLFVLTSGQIPPDPTKLLSSKKMQNVMEQLRQEFDLVIYDTPPMLGLADSSLLATYTAGIVLVVRMSKTTRSALQQALEQLKASRATVLGTIANGIRRHHAVSYNYYYRPRNRGIGVTAPMGGTPAIPASVPSGMFDAEAQSGRPAWFERLQVEQDVRTGHNEPRQGEVIPFEEPTPNAPPSGAAPRLPTIKPTYRHQPGGRGIKLAPAALVCLSLAVLGGLYAYLKQPAFFTQVSTAFSHAPSTGTQTNSFRLAVNQAMSAAVLTQSAKSEAEWHLVESQWQEAIALMRAVPSSSPKYVIAQKKVTEYQHNLSYSQQRAGNS